MGVWRYTSELEAVVKKEYKFINLHVIILLILFYF